MKALGCLSYDAGAVNIARPEKFLVLYRVSQDRCEVKNGVEFVLGGEAFHELGVPDVALYRGEVRVLEIVFFKIDRHDRMAFVEKLFLYNASKKTRTARNKYLFTIVHILLKIEKLSQPFEALSETKRRRLPL